MPGGCNHVSQACRPLGDCGGDTVRWNEATVAEGLETIETFPAEYEANYFFSPEAVCLAAAYVDTTRGLQPAWAKRLRYYDVHLFLLHQAI